MAQWERGADTGPAKCDASDKERPAPAPAKVDVNPIARDEEISKRLWSVLDATGWFTDPHIDVREGVVFLSGRAQMI